MCDYNQFEIPLDLTGDESAFRIKDTPGGEVHRSGAVEQNVSGLVLQGNLKEVIHGTLTPHGPPATLVIIEFRFHTTQRSSSVRRFRKVEIKLRFSDPSEPEGGNDPTVIKIAPDGKHGYNRTVSHKEVRHKARIGIHSGVESGNLVTLGAGYELETRSTRETTHWTTISGLIMQDQHRLWGGKNVALWCASENHNERSGVPTLIRVAVLLQRKIAQGQFLMETEISAKVDILYQAKVTLQKLFGRLEPDDAITFDPDPKYAFSTQRSDLDRENLGLCNLEGEVQIQIDPK